MHNPNIQLNETESGTLAWFGSGTVSAVGLALVVALWFTSMLFFVRGFVEGATSTQAMSDEPAYEMVVQ